jgi:hypothetical protein
LYYVQIHPDKTVSQPLELFPGHNHYISSDITGADDGRHLYIAACVKRDPDLDYSDIYFIESSDGGKSFSTPTAVPREDMNDNEYRYSPNIQLDLVSERLWIYYYARLADREVRYTSRPRRSLVFQKESKREHGTDVQTALNFRVANTDNSKVLLIYDMILKPGYYIYNFARVSQDNGINWSDLHYTAGSSNLITEDIVPSLAVYEADGQFATVYSGTDNKIYAHDYNQGREIQDAVPITPQMNAAVLCRGTNSKTLLVYTTSSLNFNVRNLGVFDMANFEKFDNFTRGERPFAGVNDLEHVSVPDMACWYDGKEKGVVFASAIGITKSGDHAILLDKGTVPDITSA